MRWHWNDQEAMDRKEPTDLLLACCSCHNSCDWTTVQDDFWRSDEARLWAAQHSVFLGEGPLFRQRAAAAACFCPLQANHCLSREREQEWIPPRKQEFWDRWTATHIIYVKILKIRPENAIAKLIWKGQAGFMRRRLAEDSMCIICNLTQAAVVCRHQLSYPPWTHRKHLTWFNRTIWIKWCWSLFFTRPLLIVFSLWTFPCQTVTKTQQDAISSPFSLGKEKHCSSVGLFILAGIKSLTVFNQVLFLFFLHKWGKGYLQLLG